jgi:hypothetical protein
MPYQADSADSAQIVEAVSRWSFLSKKLGIVTIIGIDVSYPRFISIS